MKSIANLFKEQTFELTRQLCAALRQQGNGSEGFVCVNCEAKCPEPQCSTCYCDDYVVPDSAVTRQALEQRSVVEFIRNHIRDRTREETDGGAI